MCQNYVFCSTRPVLEPNMYMKQSGLAEDSFEERNMVAMCNRENAYDWSGSGSNL